APFDSAQGDIRLRSGRHSTPFRQIFDNYPILKLSHYQINNLIFVTLQNEANRNLRRFLYHQSKWNARKS
ncbi:hypothetical protein AB9T88_17115, partial [Flavobacterium sp. LBUM151]